MTQKKYIHLIKSLYPEKNEQNIWILKKDIYMANST